MSIITGKNTGYFKETIDVEASQFIIDGEVIYTPKREKDKWYHFIMMGDIPKISSVSSRENNELNN
jgi:hypothetical protein